MRNSQIKQDHRSYYLMLLPVMVWLVIFNIYPMFGSILAFKSYSVRLGIWGSEWVGLDNFKAAFLAPNFFRVIYNTVFIAALKMICNLSVPLIFALLLNEVRKQWFKQSVQTITYMPHFLSWVILAGMFKDVLSTTGLVNKLLIEYHVLKEPIMFFANVTIFPYIIVATDVWKNFGFNAIIFLAALTSIDPGLYEAAEIDGASRWKQLIHVTLPGISATIILVATLSLQSILNAGFDQVFVMYSPLVYETGDILDTYVFRMGLLDVQFELATAIGLMKSIIGFFLILITQAMAKKYAGYRIF